MPEGCDKVPMSRILTYEEIVRICRAASGLGIRRVKITGGEPFVRLGCTELIRNIRNIDGIREVTVTTNGQSLERYIDELREIGVDGINISLDTLDPDRFAFITGRGVLEKTLRGIRLAADSGIRTKINCLPQKGFNEDEIEDIAEMAFGCGIDVRFIEMMPVGLANADAGISNTDILNRLMKRWPDLRPDSSIHGNGPAVYYHRAGIRGAVGFISAMHDKFCAYCNRVRLTSQGQLKPCLCYDTGTDLVPYLKSSDEAGGDQELAEAIRRTILLKPAEHCFEAVAHDRRLSEEPDENTSAEHINTEHINTEHRLMSQIGG